MDPRTDFAWDWQHITADTLVRMGQGVLHTIVVNTVGKAGWVEVFDGGDRVAIIRADFSQPRTLVYDLEYHVNLAIIVVGVWDLTVNYK